MKHGKKPTVKQKKAIQAARLNSDNRLVEKVFPDRLTLVHRYTGSKKDIPFGR